MFMLIVVGIIGETLVNLGLADEFVEVVKVLDMLLYPVFSLMGIGG